MKKRIRLKGLAQAIKKIEEVTAFLQLEIPKNMKKNELRIMKG